MNECMPREIWHPVHDYEGLYEVSNWGRVWSAPRNTTRGGILKQATSERGVKSVNLTKNGKQRVRLVHQLVAEAFIGGCPEGQEVRHWDGDPSNNYVMNLLYGTRSENMQDMVRHGRNNVAKTHCPQGHEYTPENTFINELGRRVCQICRRKNALNAYYRKRERGEGWIPTADLPPGKQARRRQLAAARNRRMRERRRGV